MKRSESKDTLHTLWTCARAAHALDAHTIPLILVKTLLDALLPFAGLKLIALVVNGLQTGMPLRAVLALSLGGVGVLFLLAVATALLTRVQYTRLDRDYALYNFQMGSKVLSMDYPLLDSPFVHTLRGRVARDQNWGAGIYSVFGGLASLAQAMISLSIAIGFLVPLFSNAAFFRSPLTWIFVLTFLALMGLSVGVYRGYQKKRENEYMSGSAKSSMRNVSSNMVYSNWQRQQGREDIHLYNAVPLIKAKFAENGADMEWKRESYRVSRATCLGGLVTGMCRALAEGSAYLFVAARALAGMIPLGNLLLYAGSFSRLSAAIFDLTTAYQDYSFTARSYQSLLEFVALSSTMYKGTLPVERRKDCEYALEFVNVSFQYPGSSDWALRNVSLKLNVGQRLAMVGPNGSGKTTLIKLLCRLYDPTEGEIRLNGVDIRKYDYDAYLRIFSVVFQDFKLFAFPIGQNVAASVAYDEARVRKALEQAGFTGRLEQTAKGLDTPLYKDYSEEGMNVSGGEAQKLALARAIYKAAPFLILDEPTAALDPVAEYEIYTRMNDIVGLRTAVKRPSTSPTACPPAASATTSRFLIRAAWSSAAATRSWWPMLPGFTVPCGARRPSTTTRRRGPSWT
ncbi:MAG TPA: ABC transporter ATP-binding protein [Clostridia bacterium]|nr:ABC transporter ATP-binding protein [Clostridia bacterium]